MIPRKQGHCCWSIFTLKLETCSYGNHDINDDFGSCTLSINTYLLCKMQLKSVVYSQAVWSAFLTDKKYTLYRFLTIDMDAARQCYRFSYGECLSCSEQASMTVSGRSHTYIRSCLPLKKLLSILCQKCTHFAFCELQFLQPFVSWLIGRGSWKHSHVYSQLIAVDDCLYAAESSRIY